jgi:hypothetical protein
LRLGYGGKRDFEAAKPGGLALLLCLFFRQEGCMRL